MKNLKKAIAVWSVIMTLFACLSLSASAATISSDKHATIGIKGGQTVYLTTNNAWNTSLPGGLFNTVVRVTIPIVYRSLYQKSKVEQTGRIQISTFKKVNNRWVKQNKLSGLFHCDAYSGVIDDSFRLPGKNMQYKLVITPERQATVRVPSDMTGIKLDINYGAITNVR